MGYPRKLERNKDLVAKRKSDPKKWTWGKLAEYFKISRPAAVQLFNKYASDSEKNDLQTNLKVYKIKTDRTQAIKERDAQIKSEALNTDKTYEYIAHKYGLTRQRVEQIVNNS